MIRIKIDGTEYLCEPDRKLGDVLRERCPEAAPVFACGGHGKCGKCRIIVTEGDISPVTEEERKLLSADELEQGVRLACLTRATGDCAVATRSGRGKGEVIRISGELPEFERAPVFKKYGAAVDIGTTTLAAVICRPDGTVAASGGASNPQTSYGADVVSRMEAALKGAGEELTEAIRNAVDGLVRELADKAGIDSRDIDGAVVTGNTVMLSFFAGVDTEPLTHAPFLPKELFGKTYAARQLELTCLEPDTDIYLPPCAAAFIGADVMCASLADLGKNGAVCELLTDIGTNGEMVLCAGGELFACSTAAGPAFEGAGISSGMGGFDGAIDRAAVDGSGAIQVHVIGQERGATAKGICGSGLVDAVSCLRELELVDETGYMEEESAEIGGGVCLTRKDIRAVQLAKSAIHAGVLSLLHAALTGLEEVEIFHIAGGFGSFLNVENAGKIGLIPEALVRKVHVSGNAALAGAVMLLLSAAARDEIRAFTDRVNVLELSTDSFFVNAFMEQMTFP
jgi:uncharacterized 2Fe-2S/4Fe-4S cluster protein (DUF4445 family)